LTGLARHRQAPLVPRRRDRRRRARQL